MTARMQSTRVIAGDHEYMLVSEPFSLGSMEHHQTEAVMELEGWSIIYRKEQSVEGKLSVVSMYGRRLSR